MDVDAEQRQDPVGRGFVTVSAEDASVDDLGVTNWRAWLKGDRFEKGLGVGDEVLVQDDGAVVAADAEVSPGRERCGFDFAAIQFRRIDAEGDMDRETFTATMRAFRNRTPFQPFTVAMVNGDRYEVDYAEALALRDGLAMFAAPGNIPVIFDHEGVSSVIGDLSGRGAEAS